MADPVLDELLGPSKMIDERPPVDPVLEGLLGGGLAGAAREPVGQGGGDPIARGDFSITDLITGGERVTPRVEAAKEITGIGAKPTDDFLADLKIKAGLLIAAEPGQQIDIIQSAIPGATAEVDEFGTVFVKIGDEEFLLNRPGASLQDLTQTVATILSFLPSSRFATRGIQEIAGRELPKALASRTGKAQAGRAAVSGAGTSAALDIGAQALGAEQGVDVGRATLTGALEAAVPLAGGAIRAFRGRKVPIDVEPGTVARITEAEAADVPIDLFPAQKTGVLSQLETQSFVAGLPGGSQIAFRALEKQNKQAFDATLEFVNRIAPPTAAEGGAQRFRTAAQKAIEQAKRVRREKASPLFKDAFKEAPTVKVDLSALDEAISKFPRGGEVHRAMSKAKRFIEDAGGDLEKLHNAKTEIDQIISSRKDGGLGPTTQRQLIKVQDNLIAEMEKASPTYAAARDEFKRLSPDVDALKDGIIGRAANVKDPQLKSLSRTIFDAAETDPSVIARVRKVIDAVDPAAYDDLLRIEMGRRLGALKPTQSLVENAPGQLRRALFGNQAQRKALFAALRPPQRAIAKFLDTKLGRASLGRPGGSQTAARQEIREEFKKGTVRALITFLGSPVRGLARVGEEKAITRNARAVAELIFDPSHEKSIRSIIRQSTANTREGGQELLTLLAAVAGQELGDEE